MAQVTPEEAGLAEFNPRGTAEHELLFLIAYYTKLLQTAGISLDPGDIEIGAVEIKNATTDDRATVDSSGALSTNVAKVAGTVVSVNNGVMDAGTLRVTLATDGPGVSSLTTIATNTPTRTADNAVSAGNPDYVGGLAVAGSAYAPAYTAGDRAVIPLDKDSGGILSHIRTLTTTDQVTSVPVANSVVRISTATTTVVKSGAGTLERIVVNKHVVAGVTTIYDNTAASGTILAIITVGVALLTDPPITAIYGIPFATGLTIVTSQAEDLTIVYR